MARPQLLWAEFDHMSLYRHRKAFEKWELFCKEARDDPFCPAVVTWPKFLRLEAEKKSVPLALWHHVDWLHTYAGFPWKPALSSKPKKSKAPRIAGEGQATPADPQILIELDVEAGVGQWIQAENAPYLDMADMLWQGCLRKACAEKLPPEYHEGLPVGTV